MKSAKIFIVFTFLLAFALDVLAQRNPYPNELKGYEFFGKGKLKGLKLGVSTKEDVKSIFGEICDNDCDYDENWTVNFNYLEGISKETTIDGITKRYVPSPNYAGKLYSVTFSPKSSISFNKVKFSSNFAQFGGGSAAHDGKGGGTNMSFKIYTDTYGLEYTVFGGSILTTNKNLPKRKKGDLLFIEHRVTDELEEKMFVEQK